MKTKTRQLGISILSVGLAAAMLIGVPAASAAEYTDPSVIKSDPIELDKGHMDLFNLITTTNGDLQMVIKEDRTGSGVLRTPESVLLRVKQSALQTGLEGHTAYQDVYDDGLTDSAYLLPQTQEDDLLWPGWDTTGALAALNNIGSTQASAAHKVEIVSTPDDGKVLMWLNGQWGDPASALSNGRYALPETIVQGSLAHEHINWAFTKPGTYKLKVTTTVTPKDSPATSLTANSGVYTFQVGDVDAAQLQTAIDAANRLDESGYTADSWSTFAAALDTAGST